MEEKEEGADPVPQIVYSNYLQQSVSEEWDLCAWKFDFCKRQTATNATGMQEDYENQTRTEGARLRKYKLVTSWESSDEPVKETATRSF